MVTLSCLWKVLVCSQSCMQHGVHMVLADDNWGRAGCTINTGLPKEMRQPELLMFGCERFLFGVTCPGVESSGKVLVLVVGSLRYKQGV